MDANTIMSMIGSVGFPIAMCLAMFFYMTKQSESHRTEVEKITEALNNNTLALNRLEMKLENGK